MGQLLRAAASWSTWSSARKNPAALLRSASNPYNPNMFPPTPRPAGGPTGAPRGKDIQFHTHARTHTSLHADDHIQRHQYCQSTSKVLVLQTLRVRQQPLNPAQQAQLLASHSDPCVTYGRQQSSNPSKWHRTVGIGLFDGVHVQLSVTVSPAPCALSSLLAQLHTEPGGSSFTADCLPENTQISPSRPTIVRAMQHAPVSFPAAMAATCGAQPSAGQSCSAQRAARLKEQQRNSKAITECVMRLMIQSPSCAHVLTGINGGDTGPVCVQRSLGRKPTT